LNISFNSTSINSSLNVSGPTILNKTAINNSFYVSGITMSNNDMTINSSLIVSGNIITNRNSTMNSSLYINTLLTEVNKSALSVDSSSLGVLVNIVENYRWNYHTFNYSLNVTGYSNFGVIQINGQETKQNI
jgi:hypothetical protein